MRICPCGWTRKRFIPLSVFSLDKHLNQSLLEQYRDVPEEDRSFDPYGNNLYRYSDVCVMLEDIARTARDILFGRRMEMIERMIPYSNLYGVYGKADRERFFEEHRNEIADVLLRFCDLIKALMDNVPEFDLLNFQGS